MQFEDGCERSLIETITIDSLYSFSPPAEITMDTEYSFELEIIDRANVEKASTDTVIVSYIYDEVPIAHAGNDTITNQSTIVLDGSGSSDDDYDALNYQWKYLNSSLVFI